MNIILILFNLRVCLNGFSNYMIHLVTISLGLSGESAEFATVYVNIVVFLSLSLWNKKQRNCNYFNLLYEPYLSEFGQTNKSMLFKKTYHAIGIFIKNLIRLSGAFCLSSFESIFKKNRLVSLENNFQIV